MSEAALQPSSLAPPSAAPARVGTQAACEECVGSGGWFRYEPALEPSGLLYLSCLSCRGTGRTVLPRA